METSALMADHAVRDRLTQHLQKMVNGAEELLKSAERTGSDQFLAARDRCESQLRHARAELANLEDTAVDCTVRRAARTTDLALHDHPYAAVGLAAGIGLLVGLLVSRR